MTTRLINFSTPALAPLKSRLKSLLNSRLKAHLKTCLRHCSDRPFKLFLALFSCLLLVNGCGFHLRGSALNNVLFEFQTLYVDAPPLLAPGQLLQTYIKSSVTLVNTAQDAQVVVKFLGEDINKSILSIDGTGRIREHRLTYQLDYQIIKPETPSAVVRFSRDVSYDDTKVLAKEGEEKILLTDMQQDAAQQVIRALSGLTSNRLTTKNTTSATESK